MEDLFLELSSLAAANVAIAGVNLFRPYWTRLRASLRLLADGLGAGLFCWLLKAQFSLGSARQAFPRRRRSN